ncbi:hypothetical protein ACH49_13475 [Streptomyces leeuwenhoekii]|uniref:Uncharacterized protein n=1 Tax=Streptomyces leeuwenhoekii TaxID=1437453 RepID=A0ABR5HZ82_STRLW|nr:hypothetical protein [Streptomyces leeuwenhoekii]KMS79066.1 hypothetical protein ACH49_13475 [Streptomyces leeuwenhoekii]
MNRLRLILHRLVRRPAVTGPQRIYLRRIPTGVMLDLEHFLTQALTAIADDEELLGLLLEYAADRAEPRPHDGHAPESLLLERLVGAVGYEVPVYGDSVAALADRLRALAPAPATVAPARHREGGAAA